MCVHSKSWERALTACTVYLQVYILITHSNSTLWPRSMWWRQWNGLCLFTCSHFWLHTNIRWLHNLHHLWWNWPQRRSIVYIVSCIVLTTSVTSVKHKRLVRAVYYIYLVKRHTLNSSCPWLVATVHVTIMVINAALE